MIKMTPHASRPIFTRGDYIALWINLNVSPRVPTQTRHGDAHCHGQLRNRRLNLQTLCVRDQQLRVNARIVQLNLGLPRTRLLLWEALSFGGANISLHGYNREWEKEFPWLKYSEPHQGMLCRLCHKHNQTARDKSGVWVTQPCLNMRKDKVLGHSDSQSDMHLAARTSGSSSCN